MGRGFILGGGEGPFLAEKCVEKGVRGELIGTEIRDLLDFAVTNFEYKRPHKVESAATLRPPAVVIQHVIAVDRERQRLGAEAGKRKLVEKGDNSGNSLFLSRQRVPARNAP